MGRNTEPLWLPLNTGSAALAYLPPTLCLIDERKPDNGGVWGGSPILKK